jgi:coenzyme Q-binding protein COQ10
MFALVADVRRYPEFLPWVTGTRIRSQDERELVADLLVGFRMIRESFTSRVALDRPARIHVDYVNGPLRYLHNDWRFEPDGQGGCRLSFEVDFEFRNRLFEKLAGTVFGDAVRRMVGAFEARAAALYGPVAGPVTSR